jgi:hypothetical protein
MRWNIRSRSYICPRTIVRRFGHRLLRALCLFARSRLEKWPLRECCCRLYHISPVADADDDVEHQRPEDIIEAKDDQLAVWREICDLARQIRVEKTKEYDDIDSNDDEDEDVSKERLLELWMLLICHTTGAQRYQSPLLGFCAMLSIQSSTRS